MTLTLGNFYTSKLWCKFIEQLRIERVDESGNVICAHCGRPITRKYDCIGHHVIELTDENVNDFSISLNPENVQLIHFSCHNKIHCRFDGFRQSVYLVYGSPCAGKTTWVHANANDDDLILDIDALWEAVCLRGKYEKPGRLKRNVFGLRDCMIEQIKLRVGTWRNAYVIGGYPLASDRERLCTMLRARPVFIDETRETCLDRAHDDAWRGYIDEWFDAYTA